MPAFSPLLAFFSCRGLLSPRLPPIGKLEETRLNKPDFSPSLGLSCLGLSLLSPPPPTRERKLLKPAPKRPTPEPPLFSSFLLSDDRDEESLVLPGDTGELLLALLERKPPLELDDELLDGELLEEELPDE